ncbi:small subunit ribosomal protein S11e, cytoplasmic [Guillardia theta CCMP2712]|uniref:Small subunit ribosomal protein S11e, cytoplasmic n=4 Tax=Guillardia theta TaxID=55529 RepID=L1JMW2_GUITC|nr:small subunit ribosomal protein S11e, cytoplasmic [Guillardia theta CCMP2712]EKX49931.1 small subunit ribosomal protein S11e, cytoplasmic [Guillardia theta CCMP2712]|eukprot:XP_005836911.1 small subunit ribosomal protein S11e, cytoplasmic [Guillardia theta CCMP2712]
MSGKAGHPAYFDPQDQKAYMKQPTVFQNKKEFLGKAGRKAARFVKSVGLGFKTPLEAKDGVYIDKKCPWVGNVSIRGKLLRGVVVSNKMKRTIVIRRDYMHYIKKYNRYEKRHKNVPAHVSPAFKLNPGDSVVVGQCRPLSKTVRFNVLQVITEAAGGKKFSKF